MHAKMTYRQRKNRISSSIEEYLETIYRLEKEKGVVRVKEISSAMDVSYASTSEILKRMGELGLVNHERYGYVRLQPEGAELAEQIIKREEALFHFFHHVLSLPEDLSREDACRLEHEVSDETAERLTQWIAFLDSTEGDGNYQNRFKAYVKEVATNENGSED